MDPAYVRLVVIAKVDPQTFKILGWESNERGDPNDAPTVWNAHHDEWEPPFEDVDIDVVAAPQNHLFDTLNVRLN